MSSRSNNDRILEVLARVPELESLAAVFVEQNDALAEVIQGGSVLHVPSAASAPLVPGESVRLERRNGQLILIGPTLPRSASGKVLTAGTPLLTVETPIGSGQSVQLQRNRDVTFAVNDIVAIDWKIPAAQYRLLTDSPTAPPEPPPAPPPQRITQTFFAIDSGSFQNGRWWTRDVYASSSNIGAYFYGDAVRNTIPDGSPIESARIFLPIEQSQGSAPLLGRHTAATKPAGTVAVTSTFALNPRSGWISIPLGWVDIFKVSGGGIGFNTGGFNIYRGTNEDGQSGALEITYFA